jgi:hypothetical protein
MQLSQGLVERGQPTTPGPRELGEVSVGYLPMADNSLHRNIGVRKVAGPEFVTRVCDCVAENGPGGRG